MRCSSTSSSRSPTRGPRVTARSTPSWLGSATTGLIEQTGAGARNSKTYAVTEAGLAEIRRWLRETQPDRRVRSDAALRTFFLWLLEPDEAAPRSSASGGTGATGWRSSRRSRQARADQAARSRRSASRSRAVCAESGRTSSGSTGRRRRSGAILSEPPPRLPPSSRPSEHDGDTRASPSRARSRPPRAPGEPMR